MTNPLKTLWAITFKPIYTRLFRRFFDATINRLNTTLGELATLRRELHNHVHGINVRLDELNARVADLDQQVHTVIAARWDETAMARRMAALEDGAQRNGAATAPEVQATPAPPK